jgi:hypothetical protein
MILGLVKLMRRLSLKEYQLDFEVSSGTYLIIGDGLASRRVWPAQSTGLRDAFIVVAHC